jgi:hypothetical protein
MLDGTTRSYLLADYLGSQAITTDSNGALTAELRYKAWGSDRYTWGTMPAIHHGTGQRAASAAGRLPSPQGGTPAGPAL